MPTVNAAYLITLNCLLSHNYFFFQIMYIMPETMQFTMYNAKLSFRIII